MNPFHEANQHRWEAASTGWAAMHERRGTWRNCVQDPTLVFAAEEWDYVANSHGKKVAVLGSGDNLAAFAFAGMGAEVTSVDISHNQLAVGIERAAKLGLNISFIQADVIDLSDLGDRSFDLVYTGGHVAVWVSDLGIYYGEAARILRNNGLFIINEYHPFRRLWKQGSDRLELAYDYYQRGPFSFAYNDNVLEPQEGTLMSYEFHWTVSDMINAVLSAGCKIIHTDEFGTHVGDWEGAPLQGLPENLLIVGRRV
ncbi:MAG: class I SAM-dependent methyltransferase [Saprospiraceae bacterium]|nr:class I SAM-dependent methyltransferase [Saprospiraceae bacterium]